MPMGVATFCSPEYPLQPTDWACMAYISPLFPSYSPYFLSKVYRLGVYLCFSKMFLNHQGRDSALDIS